MAEEVHNAERLKELQSLPLYRKILITETRVLEWYTKNKGNVYLSFSGGKDSTVLKHIIDAMDLDIPSVFVNTGLEYPELQKFVMDIRGGQYECFNPDVQIIRPDKRFDEVIKNYGYPVISKENSLYIRQCQNITEKNAATRRLRIEGIKSDGTKSKIGKIPEKWMYLIDAPFKISERCCDVMKKQPAKKYGKETGRLPILATMADESNIRRRMWMQYGCNAFTSKVPKSAPMSFWTEKDVIEYIQEYDVPYASVYGEIVDGKFTGVDRTGCMFCGFGVHREEFPNRFQKMKLTHPTQYEYCMKSIDDGGLGLAKVLDFIGVDYE